MPKVFNPGAAGKFPRVHSRKIVTEDLTNEFLFFSVTNLLKSVKMNIARKNTVFSIKSASFILLCASFFLISCHNSIFKPDFSKNMFMEIKVAAISFVPKKFDVDYNVEKLEKMFRKAAKKDIQLALATEGVIEGYVAYDITQGKYPPEKMREVAKPINSPIIRRFKDLAKELNICLAFGFAELIDNDVYNCAVFIDNKGKIRGKYHKMRFAEGYHPSWWYNRMGKKSRAFNTPFGRAAFLICNDRWQSDLARIPVLDGAQFLMILAYGSTHPDQDKAVLARARENGVPIVEANVGVSMIISKGEIVEVARKQEGIIFGTIEIPTVKSKANRDAVEKSYLKWRKKAMKDRYDERQKKK